MRVAGVLHIFQFETIQVELLIPQLQFLDNEGAQAELWELSRVFVDTLIEETGCQKVKVVFPDIGAAALLKYQWKAFGFSSLSDRKPVEDEDEIVCHDGSSLPNAGICSENCYSSFR